jgi:hypothetical protein
MIYMHLAFFLVLLVYLGWTYTYLTLTLLSDFV